MSFQNQIKGQESVDGHWAMNYFGKNAALRYNRRRYHFVRRCFRHLENWGTNADSLSSLKNNFVKAGLTYASTLYSARFIPGIQVLLARVINEIEPSFSKVNLSASDKEVMMAVYEHLNWFSYYFFGSKEKYKGKAFVLSQEILKEYDKGTVPLSTFLLMHARRSKLSQVNRNDRAYCRDYVKVECRRLMQSPSTLEQELGQGWKTISRLGGLIGDWGMVDVALSNDSSRAIHVKSWMCPGYIWYKVKKIFA